MKNSPKKVEKPYKVVKTAKKKKRKTQQTDHIAAMTREALEARLPANDVPQIPNEGSPVTLPDLLPNSPYLKTNIVGTTSAKLSYLISQVLKYHKDEKILIFYDVSTQSAS